MADATNAKRTAREEILAIVESFGLPLDHPSDAMDEVDHWLASPGLHDEALVDLEGLPFVTIDNEDSRDLDQALFIEDLADEGHRVHYALADAAYYVRPGSALYREALGRGASFYLPGLVLPMLPLALSEGLVSLNEGVVRRALVFQVDLDERGEVRHVRLLRARIRSRAKLSYGGVQHFWDGDTHLEHREFSSSLRALRVVGHRRIALAEARGIIHHPRVEVDVVLAGGDGHGFIAFEAKRYETDRANEQISLLVNVEGARLLAQHGHTRGLEPIFRVHPAPSAEQLEAFAAMTERLVEAHGLPRPWVWTPDEPLPGYLKRIAASLPHNLVLAIQRQALLMNHRSTFAAEPGLHHGVGAPCYARFSSPMREIVGVHTHKEALELLGFIPAREDGEDELEAIIAAANGAKEIQGRLTKAANQCAIESLLKPDLDSTLRPERSGTVLGLSRDKAYIQLDSPPLEVKVYARDFGGVSRVDEVSLELFRPGGPLTLRLGDRVGLTVSRWDTTRARMIFDLVLR
jgi:ribonuclease R